MKFFTGLRKVEMEKIIYHTIEECAEVQHILCKILRFGLYNFHPDDPLKIPNIELLLKEMTDLKKRLSELEYTIVNLET